MPERPSFRRLFRLHVRDSRSAKQEIDDELDAHFALRVEYLRSTGLSERQARDEALRRFGDFENRRHELIASAERRVHRMNTQAVMETVLQDVRFALRQIRRAPRNAYFGVISLALGIGLATALFATVNGVLLRPLPYRDANQLVALQAVDSAANTIQVVSEDDWFDWNTKNSTLDGIALHGFTFRTPVVIGSEPVRVASVVATPKFFSTIGARFVSGRDFDDDDAVAGVRVIISERLWKRAFGAQPGELTLRMNDVTLHVIGVVAQGQEFPADADMWMPHLHRQVGGAARNNVNWTAVGRLKHGVSVEAAQRDLSRIARAIHEETPQALYSYGVDVSRLQDHLVVRASVYLKMLMGAVGVVLLIACVNLASINLARGAARARELAVRAAIGASRTRLVRQLLVEHLVLAIVGGAFGLILAFAIVRGIVVLSANQLPRAGEIGIDARVLGFSIAATLLVGLLTGLLPAIQAGRTSLAYTMAQTGRGTSRGWTTAGRMLVASELALAVVLVIGGGLLLQSFRAVLATPLGYETHGVTTAELSLSGLRYRTDPPRMQRFWSQLLQSLRASPGVTSVGVANWIPLGMGGQSFLEVEGHDLPNRGGGYRVVSGGYFSALKIPLIAGRDFAETDDSSAMRVGIINRGMAESFWPGENPLGKRLRSPSMEPQPKGAPSPWITVIGVVGDVRHWGAESERRPELYVHYAQLPSWWKTLTLTARTGLSQRESQALVRARIHEIDPLIAVDIEPFDARLDRTVADRRFTMSLLVGFGAMALVLAAIGVYSVLAFQVALRTREMAVRAALGAERGRILRLVMFSGARFITAGVVVGLLGSIALSRIMQSLVFEVSSRDPFVFAASTLVILGAALAAAFIPALRATRIAPMLALAQE